MSRNRKKEIVVSLSEYVQKRWFWAVGRIRWVLGQLKRDLSFALWETEDARQLASSKEFLRARKVHEKLLPAFCNYPTLGRFFRTLTLNHVIISKIVKILVKAIQIQRQTSRTNFLSENRKENTDNNCLRRIIEDAVTSKYDISLCFSHRQHPSHLRFPKVREQKESTKFVRRRNEVCVRALNFDLIHLLTSRFQSQFVFVGNSMLKH